MDSSYLEETYRCGCMIALGLIPVRTLILASHQRSSCISWLLA
ncbi:Bgt-51228 [Blumeria graminis f. sp. tritici]|uniref:Bgt-51228 n=1 Tax=Blumeria graminis f. sp. tritici TaxID=62690 RepID=A0A9X9MIS5_BLUGR|nr:Bgt-51228 [Blumeria graminis f. sp. tritici]